MVGIGRWLKRGEMVRGRWMEGEVVGRGVIECAKGGRRKAKGLRGRR